MSQDKMTSTAQGESIKVIRFDGKNFSLWKLKIMALLETLDLLDVVVRPGTVVATSNTSKSRSGTSTSNDEDTYEKKTKKAYAILVNSLLDEQLNLVIN